MKCSSRCKLSILLAIALAGTPHFGIADWLYDSDAKTITDGAWTISVKESDEGLVIMKDVSDLNPSPDTLDLSTPVNDQSGTSYRIVAIRGNSAFSNKGCWAGLKQVTLPDTLTDIAGWSFAGCAELATVEPFLPGGVTNIGDCAFANCSKLTSALVVTNPRLKTIGYQCFKSTRIADVRIPGVLDIGRMAFLQCGYMTNLVLSAQLRSLGFRSFEGSARLKTITPLFPETIESIGESAFASWGTTLEGPVVFPPKVIDLSTANYIFRQDSDLDFYFPKKAPDKAKLSPTIFEASSPKKTKRIVHGSLRLDPTGWAALVEPVTEEDRANAFYPGPKTFGVLVLNGIRYFCVDYKSPLDPKGLVLLVR